VENSDMFVSLKPRRLSDGAVDQILTLVRGGQLPPGSKLPPERELITRLSVSRTSLREAIRILETMGVLRVVPGRGTWVRGDYADRVLGSGLAPLHDPEDMWELFEMRETLEVRAATLAAERATPEQIEAIVDAVTRYSEVAESGDVTAMSEADRGVHEAITRASRNRYLVEVLDMVHDRVQEVRQALVAIPGRSVRIAREHEPVLEAIEVHDPVAAAKAMSRHVHNAEEELRAAAAVGAHLTPGG
jgi:GntR family transcriptional regulator, transcriptional repressor for pyruvate dehydrogenase complex